MAVGGQAGEALGEPQASGSQLATRWTERQRATTVDVQRYTRFVSVMKRTLIVAASALLAAVVAYSLQPRLQNSKRLAMTFQRLHILNNDLMMTKPRLTGVDADGNPYVVTADEAIQDPHNAKHAQLRHVEADVTLKAGNWLNATATHGILDASMQKLRLSGIIDVYSDNGYEVHTSAADIDMRTGAVVGNLPATGQGPLGTFRSDRFRINRVASNVARKVKTYTTRIYLYGHVFMTIYKQHRTGHL